MPEMPEMEAYRQNLIRWALGRTVVGLDAPRPKRLNQPVDVVRAAILRRPVARIERRGKSLALILGRDNSAAILYIHLMLGGRIRFVPEDQEAAVSCYLSDNHAVYFHVGLGRIDLMDHTALAARWDKLGVEPLESDFKPGLLRRAFHARRRSIKACLTDQNVVSGIGNVYSDEILYRVRLYPGTPANALDADDWEALDTTIPEVLSEAVTRGGVGEPTDPDDRLTGGYRTHLQVHYRAGAPCGRGDTVMKEEIAGRTTYWCPSVQMPRS